MGDVLCRIGRAHRGLRGDHLTAGGTDQNPKQSEGPKRGGGWRRRDYFVSRCKGAERVGGKWP